MTVKVLSVLAAILVAAAVVYYYYVYTVSSVVEGIPQL